MRFHSVLTFEGQNPSPRAGADRKAGPPAVHTVRSAGLIVVPAGPGLTAARPAAIGTGTSERRGSTLARPDSSTSKRAPLGRVLPTLAPARFAPCKPGDLPAPALARRPPADSTCTVDSRRTADNSTADSSRGRKARL